VTEKVIIGDATLWHGDCLEVLPMLGGFDAVVTDPPYAHKHLSGGGFAGARKFYASGEIDFISDFILQDYADTLSGVSDQFVSFCSRDLVPDWLRFGTERYGNFDLHIWHKTNAIPFTHNTWKSDLEYIVLGWRVKSHQVVPQHQKSKAWISGLCTDDYHPTAKPVGLMAKYCRILTAPAGSVCDPFMGSGTTGVACMQLGRKFTGIEIERKYFDIACERVDNAQRQSTLFDPDENLFQVPKIQAAIKF
jgi:DNA modification methylase